jgi:hypothetical protein
LYIGHRCPIGAIKEVSVAVVSAKAKKEAKEAKVTKARKVNEVQKKAYDPPTNQ